MLCVRMYYDNTYVKVWLINHGLENVIHVISVRLGTLYLQDGVCGN
jgi:hypothetical protein